MVGFEELKLIADTRILNLDSDKIWKISDWENYAPCINRAVELFCTSRNWNAANSIYFDLITHIFDKLSDSQIVEILCSPRDRRSDLVGSAALVTLLGKLISSGKFTRTNLIEKLKGAGLWDSCSHYPVLQENAE